MIFPYIFSIAYSYICISASPEGRCRLAVMPILASPPTTTPPALRSNSPVSVQQHQGGIRIGAGMSGGPAIPAMVENPSGIGSEAAATPAKSRDQRRAYPHFLKQSVLFEPNSLGLTSESARRLALDVGWLRKHPEIRTVVVGFCDPLGSEECTHELAERRGNVAGQHLAKYGVGSSQIVAAKGWEKADPVCVAATPACQAMNRRARIFIADFGPVH